MKTFPETNATIPKKKKKLWSSYNTEWTNSANMNNTYLNLEPLCLILLPFSPLLCIGIPSWKSFHFAEVALYLTASTALKWEHRLQQGTAFEQDPRSQAVCSATSAEAPFNKEQMFINTMSPSVKYLRYLECDTSGLRWLMLKGLKGVNTAETEQTDPRSQIPAAPACVWNTWQNRSKGKPYSVCGAARGRQRWDNQHGAVLLLLHWPAKVSVLACSHCPIEGERMAREQNVFSGTRLMNTGKLLSGEQLMKQRERTCSSCW